MTIWKESRKKGEIGGKVVKKKTKGEGLLVRGETEREESSKWRRMESQLMRW